jgi:5-methylcytosine-specific restriction endonuclease McrA
MDWIKKYNPKVLVLNNSYTPLDVVYWPEAMSYWANGRADIMEHYEREDWIIHSGRNASDELSVNMVCPSVIRLKDAGFNQYNLVAAKPYNRKSLWEQYKGKCCYCNIYIPYQEYTIEHVIPQSTGGLSTWQNCAPCCKPCNSTKDDKPLEDTGFKLQYELKVPTFDTLVPKGILLKIGSRVPSDTWKKYIYWQYKGDEDE